MKNSILVCAVYIALHCAPPSPVLGASDENHWEPATKHYTPLIEIPNMPINYWSICEPEVFHHDYITSGNLLVSVENSWLPTRPGQRGNLQKICLKPNGVPVTRLCLWNSRKYKAEWEPITHWQRIKCLSNTRESIITPELNELLNETLHANATNQIHNVQSRLGIARRMRNLLQKPNHQLLPADVHFTTQILTTLSSGGIDVNIELSQDVLGICSTLLSTNDRQALQISSKQLNATNEFLKTFEYYMDNLAEKFVPKTRCGIPLTTSIVAKPSGEYPSENGSQLHTVEIVDLSHIGVSAHLSANVSVFFVNPDCAKIAGISIYDETALKVNGADKRLQHESHGNFFYRFVYMNESTTDLMRETGVQIATFFPESLWKHVKRHVVSWRQPYVVFKIYDNDALFIDENDEPTCKAASKIISISIPGYSGQFPEVLPLVLRNKNFKTTPSKLSAVRGTGCGYWNYSTWAYSGVETNSQSVLQAPVIRCGTRHLTQFSFLIGGTYKQTDFGDSVLISPEHQRVLDIISLLGCSISLLGLLGIWMTAALFKSWRSMASTKVLLNMCVALTLQMVLFIFLNTDDMSEHLIKAHTYGKCVALGAVMQYSILVLFTWMLIVAFLQFQRYVTVLGIDRPNHYILKSAVAAWGFPLIPTLLVACIDSDSYIPSAYQLRTDTGICYPSGYALIFGIVLPITLICIVNLTIFIYVFYSISTTLNQSMARQEKNLVIRQIRLSILLFFLLGLSWIFGIFAFMHAGIVFSYLFCLTATLQGFVLFLYFVVFEEVPRRAWQQLLCETKHDKTDRKASEMQSITRSTGLESGQR